MTPNSPTNSMIKRAFTHSEIPENSVLNSRIGRSFSAPKNIQQSSHAEHVEACEECGHGADVSSICAKHPK